MARRGGVQGAVLRPLVLPVGHPGVLRLPVAGHAALDPGPALVQARGGVVRGWRQRGGGLVLDGEAVLQRRLRPGRTRNQIRPH